MTMQPLQVPSNLAPDEQMQRLQFDFTGEWLPDLHPLKIGNGNYSDVNNVRYTKTGIKTCNGYTIINVTPIATYIKGRNGFQLRTPNTQKSYIFTQQWNSALSASVLMVNKGTPPATSNFEGSALHADASGATQGFFAEAPNNDMIYCNSLETLIYGGDESAIGAFVLATSITGLTPVAPIIYTNEIRNILTTAENIVAFVAASNIYLVGSTRPLSGIKPYISVANASASTPTIKEWTGTAWSACAVSSDDSSVGGVTHATTGMISFTSTVTTSKPAFITDQLLYWYQVSLSAGTCTIYHTTVKAPIQNLVDLWDGVNRVCIQCEVSRSSVYGDYTAEVYDTSTIQYPIAANFSGLAAADFAILMFQDRITAIKFAFLGGFVNTTVSTLTLYYWDGTNFTSVGTLYDGTLSGGKAMNLNGTVYWNPPSSSVEHKVNLFSTYGYAYKLVWSGGLSGTGSTTTPDGCWPDTIYGIPAVKTMGAYKFAFNYKNRIFLAGDVAGKEGHGIDYGVRETSDSFNGQDSSANNKRLYIGKNSSDVIAAANVFNRFGASLYNSELILKPNETYLLDGDDPESFRVSQISENIGCIAPRTLSTAEVAFEMSKDAIRNIAIWVSSVGPILFDAAVIVPLLGVNLYFDKTNDVCVNFDYLSNAHAWFDPNYYEWNLCLPSGTDQVTCNVWLAYDLINKRWTKRNVGSQYIPQATIKIITAGFYVGALITTNDPDNIGPFLVTAISANTLTFAGKLGIEHLAIATITLTTVFIDVDVYIDGSNTPVNLSVSKIEQSDNFTKLLFGCNITHFCIQFKFSLYSKSTGNNVLPLVWGPRFMFEREDIGG